MPFIATIEFLDSFGRRTTKRLETETDVLLTATAAVTTLLTQLDVLTDLQCVGVSYSLKDATQVFAGQPLSNIDRGATFRLRLNDGRMAPYKIPGFPLSKVIANGHIDPSDVDVQSYFANFADAGAFTLSDGETMVEVVSGELDR